jgi:hypothetical protein
MTTAAHVDSHLKTEGGPLRRGRPLPAGHRAEVLVQVRAPTRFARGWCYDTVDLHWVRNGGAARVNPSDTSLAERAAFYARVEPFVSAMSDVVLTVTDVEKQTLLSLDPALTVRGCSVRASGTVRQARPGPPAKTCCSSAASWHQPNVDAVLLLR